MKKIFSRLFAVAYLLALPCTLFGADISVDSTSMLRFERRDINGASRQDLFPATQFLGLDLEKLGDGNLSAHIYGWGRADLGDKSFNNDRYNGSITYGYLQYRFKEANADIRAGRFFVHEGIVNEHVDGAGFHTDLPFGFGVSAFGGATVRTAHLFGETSDGKGDALFGGRLNYRYKGLLELGLSGVYEGNAPALKNFSNGNHRLIGGDIWLSPHRMVELFGHSSYNPETERMAEHSYLLNIKPLKGLVLTGDFNEQNDRSNQFSWSMFSGASLNPADKSRSIGAGASYEIGKGVELTADYKHYTREIGNADRFGGNARFSLLKNELRCGLGYHYLRASSGFAISGTPSASYHELRGYVMHDTKTYFAALDALGFIFKEKIYDERTAWEVMGSLGYRITAALALSGDVSYGRNPEFSEDFKGLLRLTYNMTFNGLGGKK